MECSKWKEENQDCMEKYFQEKDRANCTKCIEIQNMVRINKYPLTFDLYESCWRFKKSSFKQVDG